jgi:hypothetical protein
MPDEMATIARQCCDCLANPAHDWSPVFESSPDLLFH